MCPRTVRSHSIATCQEQAQAVVRAEAGTEAESCMSGQEIWTLSVFTGGGGGVEMRAVMNLLGLSFLGESQTGMGVRGWSSAQSLSREIAFYF